MDEISVRFCHGGKKGFLGPGPVRKDALRTERASQVQVRGALTLVTFVCYGSDLQPLMPQVIICSNQVRSVRDLPIIPPTPTALTFFRKQTLHWMGDCQHFL